MPYQCPGAGRELAKPWTGQGPQSLEPHRNGGPPNSLKDVALGFGDAAAVGPIPGQSVAGKKKISVVKELLTALRNSSILCVNKMPLT